MKPLLLTLAFIVLHQYSHAQTNISNEAFELSFKQTNNGGMFVFNGKNHSFTLNIVSDSIEITEAPGYIKVGNKILQVNIVALPANNLNLSRLTDEELKGLLTGYVDYEMDYFKTDLKLKVQNLHKEWATINGKLWLWWWFDVPKQNLHGIVDVDKQTKTQIYASSICFNQVLDVNTPLLPGNSFLKGHKLLTQLMASLKLQDNRFKK